MFGSEILEVAIGVIFVFLLVSVICTAIREGMESFLKTRAAFLEHGIREMLHDRGAVGIARSFYTHPLINSLYAENYTPRSGSARPSVLAHGGTLPTYIPTRNFALALMDIAARGPTGAPGSSDGSSPVLSLANVRANVLNLENAPVQRILLTAIDTAQGDMDKAVANLAAWYDSGMDRVSGAYKRATQKVLFFIGLFVALALNVNPLTVADYLYHDDSARAAVVARAEAAAKDPSYADGSMKYTAARAELDSLRLPIGWGGGAHFWIPWSKQDTTAAAKGTPSIARPNPWDGFFSPLIGWIITAMAATLGAPFWFDILNKVMVVRSTVKPHEKSPEESSEDRQSDASKAAIAKGDVGATTHAVGAGTEPAQGSVAGAPAGPPPVQPVASAAPPGDAEATVDGCDVEVDPGEHTSDEALPAATGGVA
jgi:hypothetical protein